MLLVVGEATMCVVRMEERLRQQRLHVRIGSRVVHERVVVLSGSVALVGDTLHNFANALTAVPLLIAFRLALRPPNKRYTYGYGSAEDLAGIFVVAMIALSSGLAAWQAIDRL